MSKIIGMFAYATIDGHAGMIPVTRTDIKNQDESLLKYMAKYGAITDWIFMDLKEEDNNEN